MTGRTAHVIHGGRNLGGAENQKAACAGTASRRRRVVATVSEPRKRTIAASVIACAGDATACTAGAATTAPSIVVRQIVEPTPKTRPWYSPSACWWIAVVITTSANPFATPKAPRRERATSALPDQAKATKRQPIAPRPGASHLASTRLAAAPVSASPTIIPVASAAR